MRIALDWLLAVPVAYVSIEVLYLVIVTFAAFFFKKRVKPTTDAMSIAVVVPAHNEALGIADTVSRLLESDYPRDRFAVFVLADNCDDDTAARAREAGATVIERTDPDNRGKGQALDWCFHTHPELTTDYKALAIVDADTSVHPRFLSEMALSLSHPDVVAVQGRHGVANPEANWRTALVYAAFTLINHVRPTGRDGLGSTAGLNGNGMAFRSGLIAKYGWPAKSVVEDVEFSVQLLLDDVKVHYNPDAIVTTDMPTTRAQAAPQRRRWELGRLQVARMHVPGLLKRFLLRPRWPYLDTSLDLLVPPISMFVMAQGALFLLAAAFASAWWPVLALCLLGTGFHVVSGLYLGRAPKRVWLCLLAVPLFLLWKLPLYVTMAFRPKQKTWVRTARKGEIDKEDNC